MTSRLKLSEEYTQNIMGAADHAEAKFKVGDLILFDHFGAKNRPGEIVKITPGAVHVAWHAPSSGKSRVVKLSTKPYPLSTGGTITEFDGKNVRKMESK